MSKAAVRTQRKQSDMSAAAPVARKQMRQRGSVAELEKVRIAVNAYCIRHFAIGFTGGTPRCLSLKGIDVWIVPIVLTSPGYGVVGEVGIIALDAGTHEVIDATPREEVKAAAARLAEENRDVLDAAFRQATKS